MPRPFPKPLTAARLYDHLCEVHRDGTTLDHVGCRDLVARMLARLPYLDQLTALAQTVFVMAGPGNADYLSAKLVGGRNVVVLGEGLLELSEDEQAAIVLPLLAFSVLKSRHRLESPAEFPNPTELWFDRETGRERQPSAAEVEEYEARVRAFDDEAVNLQIDAHFAKKAAAELARKWQSAWKARVRPEGDRRQSVGVGGDHSPAC